MGVSQKRLDHEIGRLIEAMIAKSMEHNEQLANVPGVDASTYPGANDEPRVADSDVGSAVDGVVKRLYAPWRTLPGPADFDYHLERLRDSASELTNQKETSLADAENFTKGGQLRIPGYMAEVKTNLSQWNGETVSAFRRQYSDRFLSIVATQANLYSVLTMVMEANQEMYRHSWEDIIEITKLAADAMWGVEDAWGINSDTNVIGSAFTLLSAVAGIVGAAVSGPIAALALAGITEISGVAASSIAASDHSANPLGSEHVDGVFNNLVAALEKLRGNINDCESDLKDLLNGVYFALRDGNTEVGADSYGNDIMEPTMNLLSPPPVGDLSDVKRPAAGYDVPEHD